ncbi:MAG: lysophospholipid acyltransferase family protein [Spirochaetaceae bacterium]
MKARKPTAGILARPNVHRFLRMTVGTWLRLRFNITAENAGLLRRVRRPYLLLPNHVGYWDPFQLSSFVPYPVHHVAADQNFRTRLVRCVMWLVGAIPKTKGMSDSELIRTILRLRDRGAIISLFPEGQRTWDGASLPVLYSTAKLVKLLRIPVIVPVFKGGYFSHPRWARSPRRGRLVIEFRHAFDGDEIRGLTADEIYARLSALLAHDDYAWQAAHMVRFRGRRPAEHIEHVLFLCPRCNGTATLRSHRRRVTCSACGYGLTYTDYGYLRPDDAPRARLTVRELNRRQLERFGSYLDGISADTPIFSETDTVLSTGYRTNPVRRIAPGTITLYADRLVFHPQRPGRRAPAAAPAAGTTIALSRIEGLNVQLTTKLELYFDNRLYTFDPLDPARSMYKWQVAIEHLSRLPCNSPGHPA